MNLQERIRDILLILTSDLMIRGRDTMNDLKTAEESLIELFHAQFHKEVSVTAKDILNLICDWTEEHDLETSPQIECELAESIAKLGMRKGE